MKKYLKYIITILLLVALYLVLSNKTKTNSKEMSLDNIEVVDSKLEQDCYEVDMKWVGQDTYLSYFLRDLYRLEETKNLSVLLPKKNDIKKIKIHSQSLIALPEELFEFKNIEQLDISDNPFTDLEKVIDDLAKFPKLRILAMSHCGIIKLPDNILKLKSLEALALDQNINMTEVNDNIGELRNLRFLTFRRNKKLKDLPKTIGNLKCLELINISGAGFTRIREELTYCKQLKNITANASNIKTLPENLGGLKNLKILNLGANKIETIPESIGDLEQLIDLSLGTNDISNLPESITNLDKLYSISLELNRFKTFPNQVMKLKNLGYLDLHNNSFKEIPIEVVDLPKLRRIYVDHELISDKNIEALRNRNPEIEVERHDALRLAPDEPKRKN